MAMQIDQWEVETRPFGWVRLREHSQSGPVVYLQYALTGQGKQERIGLESVVMRAGTDEELSGRVWRRIPLSQVEQSLSAVLSLAHNGPTEGTRAAGEKFRRSFADGPSSAPTLDALDEYFSETSDTATVAIGTAPGTMFVGDSGDRVPQLTAPEGRLTDDFLKDVADAYRWATEAGRSPAPAIAEISGAPVRTVHRWVYEARKRDILPPARTGRAG
ncbi:hypothetical protein SVIOM342S_05141 [Streptomyces violaceorubidus]